MNMNNNLSDDGFGPVVNDWSIQSVWSDDEKNNSDASHNTPPPSTPPSTQHEDNKTAKAPPLLPTTRARRSKSSTAKTSHTAAPKQKYAVGTTVSKVFVDDEMGEERLFSGSVMGYDAVEKLYSVKYEDGDEEELNEQELSKIIDEGGSGKIQAKAATSNKQQGKLKGKSSSTNNDAYFYSSYDDMVAAKKKAGTEFTMKDNDNMDEDSDSGAVTKKKKAKKINAKAGGKKKKVTYTDNNDTEDDDTEDDEGLGDSDDEEMLSKKKKAKKINAKAGGKKKGGGKGGGNKHKTFAQRLEDLRAYKEKHGHVNVKQSEDRGLYKFCNNTRYARNNPEKSNTVINVDRIASLDALGFDWSVTERAAPKPFEQRMDELRAYKEKHGHINVKRSEDRGLYKFCNNTRYARNNPEKSSNVINAERIASLDALGFDWSVTERAAPKPFEQRLEELRQYKEKHGHVNVEKSEDKSLYGFCKDMNYARNNPEKSNHVINAERIASLDALGFEWTANVAQSPTKSFEQRIEDLRAYKEKHGHVNVKKSEDKSLYGFCKNMRLARNNPETSNKVINAERIASLDALGFEWRANTANRGEAREQAHGQMQQFLVDAKQYYSRPDIQQTESGKRIASLELDQSNLSTNNPIEMGMEESANEDADAEARGENVSVGATAVSHVAV